MIEIWLCQYLCPLRHAIGAIPYEPADQTAADIEQFFLAAMHGMKLDPWCGICGSRELKFEHRRTVFTSWADALRGLTASAEAQAQTRAMLSNRQN